MDIGELTSGERETLKAARGTRDERTAIERYSNLWESVERRLGREHPSIGETVRECLDRSYDRPPTPEDYSRIELMRATYVLSRTGMPHEMRLALLLAPPK